MTTKTHIPATVVLTFVAEIIAITAICFSIGLRITRFYHAPALWIDETFTGAIASQQTLFDVIHLAKFDSPPISYYIFMHFWQMLFGLSDTALRAPSLIFSIITPLIILFAKIPGLTRSERLIWAALLALWIPGIGFAQDARFYAVLLMFATIQTLAFQKLIIKPSLSHAMLWVLSATLSMLAHFDAAYLALAQGFIYVALKRRAALATWPAMLLTIPVIAEVLWRWPILSRFAQAGTAWYPMLVPFDLIGVGLYFFGGLGASAVIWLLCLPMLLAGIFLIGRRSARFAPDTDLTALAWAAASAAIACAAIVAVGFIKPTFTWRYLAPFEPGIMLGLLLITRTLARQIRDAAYIGLIIIALMTCKFWISTGAEATDSVVKSLSIAKASESLMKEGVSSVVFVWDNPNSKIISSELLTAVGGFFFHRAHYQANIHVLQLNSDINPNIQILNVATASHAAIIWLYDLSIQKTDAKIYPPNIVETNSNYNCENYGSGFIESVTCHFITH